MTAALLTTIFLAGCQSEPESPRHVIAGFDTAPRIPITLNHYSETVSRELAPLPQPSPAPVPQKEPTPQPEQTQASQPGQTQASQPPVPDQPPQRQETPIPAPWMPQQPEAPWYYQDNFYYQWPTYRNSYYPSKETGPFDTRYNRSGERISESVSPAELRQYQQRPQTAAPLSQRRMIQEQRDQSVTGNIKKYQMSAPTPSPVRPTPVPSPPPLQQQQQQPQQPQPPQQEPATPAPEVNRSNLRQYDATSSPNSGMDLKRYQLK